MNFFEVALLGTGIAMIVIGIMVLYRLKGLSESIDVVWRALGPCQSLNTWLHHLHGLDSIEKHTKLIYDLLRPEEQSETKQADVHEATSMSILPDPGDMKCIACGAYNKPVTAGPDSEIICKECGYLMRWGGGCHKN